MSKLDCVVITGAGQGTGKAIAAELGRQKIHVLCVSKSDKCEETAAEIVKAGGSAKSLRMDIGGVKKTKELMTAWIAGKSFKRILDGSRTVAGADHDGGTHVLWM